MSVAIADEPCFPLMESSPGAVEETALCFTRKLDSFVRQSEVCLPVGKLRKLFWMNLTAPNWNRGNRAAAFQ